MNIQVQFDRQMSEEELCEFETEMEKEEVTGNVSFHIMTNLINKSFIVLSLHTSMGTLYDAINMLEKLDAWIKIHMKPKSIILIG